LEHLAFLLEHPANFLNAENTLMVFSIINISRIIFYFCSTIFVPQNFHKLVYVASVKDDLKAYLFSGGVRALVKSIRWVVVGFRCQRRKGTQRTYRLVIRMTIRIADPYGHTDL